MRSSPIILGLALSGLLVTSCHRDQASSADALLRAVQKLNAQVLRNTAVVAELAPLASEIAHDCTALQSAIAETRSETEEWQRQAQGLQAKMTISQQTGVLPEHIVPGAQLESINSGGKFYRNVTVDSISAKGVLIHHADGIARLNPIDVLGHEIAPPPSAPVIPRYTISQATTVPPVPSTAAPLNQPPRYISGPTRIKPAPIKPRPQEVEILTWWGRGSPHSSKLRDAFGNPLVAIRSNKTSGNKSPGPRAPRPSNGASSGSQNLRGQSGMVGYRPIGWNYKGSDLDFIYGRKP